MVERDRKLQIPAFVWAFVFGCRWEVELLFRELKTQYELDEFDTSNPEIVRFCCTLRYCHCW